MQSRMNGAHWNKAWKSRTSLPLRLMPEGGRTQTPSSRRSPRHSPNADTWLRRDCPFGSRWIAAWTLSAKIRHSVTGSRHVGLQVGLGDVDETSSCAQSRIQSRNPAGWSL